MATLNETQVKAREKLVRGMLDGGSSINDIAKSLGLTQQAIHKFMKHRGWKTQEALRRDGVMTVQVSPEEQAKALAKAERAERRKAMTTRVDRSGSLQQKD